MNALAALNRAYEAWRLTEPQLFLTDEVLWPDSGLDEGGVGRVPMAPLVEPANPLQSGGGLDSRLGERDPGAESSPTSAATSRSRGEGIIAHRGLQSRSPSRDRLDPGAEPCREQRELTANRSYAAPQPLALSPERRLRVGAPINTKETGANLTQRSRARLQKGA